MNQESKTSRKPHFLETLLGHKDVRTTMIDTHVVSRGPLGVISPLDRAG